MIPMEKKKQRKKKKVNTSSPLYLLIPLAVAYSFIFFTKRTPDPDSAALDSSQIDSGIAQTTTVPEYAETTADGSGALTVTTAATLLSGNAAALTSVQTSYLLPETVTTTAALTVPVTETQPAAASGNRQVFVTFDDGPCKNTPQVLSILDQYGAKATFFTVGCFVDVYAENAAEIVRHGNLIACHSFTHEMDQTYASVDSFANELEQWKQSVTNACGQLPDKLVFRFPGGSTTRYAKDVRAGAIQRLDAGGWLYFDWNAGDNDKWQKGNTENLPDEQYFMKSYRECINWFNEKPDEPVILLLHETEIGTVNILPQILQDLIDRGYSFHLLSERTESYIKDPV